MDIRTTAADAGVRGGDSILLKKICQYGEIFVILQKIIKTITITKTKTITKTITITFDYEM